MARSRFTGSSHQFRMGLGNDLRHVEEHIAEARRTVHRQKGLIIRVQAAGVISWDAQKILWLPESNLRRLEEHLLRESIDRQQT